MKKLEIGERKQFIALLIHHMLYSDDKYVHILSMLDRWESETPSQGFDFNVTDIKNLTQTDNKLKKLKK